MPTFQDLSHAIRSLRKRPGFTTAALVMLTVGIGANVTVFTIVNAMLFRPLPFGERSDRVVTVHSTHRLQAEDWGWGDSELSYPDLLDLRAAESFEGLAGYLSRNFTLTDQDDAERVQGGSVTPDLFDVLEVEPMLGRSFLPEEAAPPGLESAVILTHGLWQRRYGGDPGIVGRGVVINDRARTVVGIMPPNFKFPERDELYLPLRWDESPRSARNVNVVGAVKPGVSLETAQSELDAIAARLSETYPDTNRGFGVRVLRFRDSQLGGDERALSIALMAAVGFVLLIACANLANLFLVRGAARQREIALRAAIGASRSRLLWHVLAESLVLSVAGAALGLLVSQWSLDFIRRSFPEELPFWLRLDPDARVMVFAMTAAIFTAVATGLLPALRAARTSVIGDLKDNSRGVSLSRTAQRVQGGLAIAQVALCLALLVGANLMIRSFLALQNADLGFDHRPLLTARAYLAGDAYDDVKTRGAFFARAVAALRELPGVQAAAATTSIPGDDGGGTVRLVVDGQATTEQDIPASAIGVTPEVFDALGVRLLEGRTFNSTEASDPEARVTVVNARLAERLWPGESAVDRRVGIRNSTGVAWYRVIGVAPDVQYEEIGEETQASILNMYVPYTITGARTMAFIVHAQSSPALLMQPVRDALRHLHAGLPLYEVMPMTERRRFTTWEQRFFGQMMGVFAAIALLLACIGVYALLSYAARRRTQEVGVRLALGAKPADVVWLFVRQGTVIAIGGLLLGSGLAVGVARALSGSLWGVDALDVRLYAGMAAALLAAVMAASYWPARRASRSDPVTALRTD
ncbi:MAG TPA: ABC transporter permease [Vicinamibacterales bacterium]|nr:ABC transporter permease [Vicinamibacterales bacterium]